MEGDANKYAKIRIVGDGTASGTRVLTESGHQLEGVQRIEFALDGRHELATCTLHFVPWKVDYDVQAQPSIQRIEQEYDRMMQAEKLEKLKVTKKRQKGGKPSLERVK